MQNNDILALAGFRIDGRRSKDLRSIQCNLDLVNGCDGSSYLEQGLNKVMVVIHGPQEPKQKHTDDSLTDKCHIECNVIISPFVGTDWKAHKNTDKRILELEHSINEISNEIIIRETYSRSEINIIVHVLESDGALLCTIINALNLALINAGICMYDMISSCAVVYLNKDFYIDPTLVEQNNSNAYLPIVMKAKTNDIMYMQLDNRLSMEHLELALDHGIEGCKQIIRYMETMLRNELS